MVVETDSSFDGQDRWEVHHSSDGSWKTVGLFSGHEIVIIGSKA